MSETIILPPHSIDRIGNVFGRLTVIAYAGKNRHGQICWACRCSCGKETTVVGMSLSTGNSKSCGCLIRDITSARRRSHGMSSTRLYRCWKEMRQRCMNPKSAEYPRYGARGIKVCERWNSFDAFRADMGVVPGGEGWSIDRIDNNGNYQPDNVRWATRYQQNRNKRTNRMLTLAGVTKCLEDWATELDVTSTAIARRIDRMGWSVERAITHPFRR